MYPLPLRRDEEALLAPAVASFFSAADHPQCPEWPIDLLIRDAAGLVEKTEKQP